jgi:thiamine-monophosphate kinase
MFENKERTDIAELGEFGLIKHLTEGFKIRHESSIKGVGDDAAVLNFKDKEVLVSTDLLLEGIHFDLAFFVR